MSTFGAATAVRPLGSQDGPVRRYEVDLDKGFGIGDALNGGYLMAILNRAAVDASPHEHPVATSASFMRVAKPGPAEVVVESRKEGRTTAALRVSLVQDERPIVDALVSTGTLDPDAEPVWATEAPLLKPVDDCSTFSSGKGDRGFADRVDMRFDPATMGWLDREPTGRLEMRSWFRLREEHVPDAYVLALAVDALPPVSFNVGAYGWAPTVELTWHMRSVPAPGWLAVHGTGQLLSDGWFDEVVEVWDSAGKLVAQSRQLARAGIGTK